MGGSEQQPTGGQQIARMELRGGVQIDVLPPRPDAETELESVGEDIRVR
jgi:hypothetical protein